MTIHYVGGLKETRQSRLARLLPMLACPRCFAALLQKQNSLKCKTCGATYPIREWVPILLPSGVEDLGAATSSEDDPVSRHPYSASALDIIAAHEDGFVLDLGAGGKLDRYPNVIQLDIFRYPAIDVVASADRLPFADDSFDAVVSQAVFEHLQYPEWVVAEIRRVLKVGGVAKIDTAFLQPEHGYPHHFFNATESGLRHWFRDFDIAWSGVEPFQQPKWALHWFLGVYLDYIGSAHASVLRSLSVGDLAEMLQRHAVGATQLSDLKAIEALDSLPPRFQRVLAAGVAVRVVNRPKLSSSREKLNSVIPWSVDREREMELLRAEQLQMSQEALALHERLRCISLKADYLFQFSPGIDRSIVTFADVVGPKASYLDAVSTSRHFWVGGLKPFVTLVINPSCATSLLDTFFSLAAQIFSGWQLLIVLGKGAQPTLTGIASRLAKLDGRVKIHVGQTALDLNQFVDGEYYLQLKPGATLRSNALEEVVSAARFTPNIAGVSFDYERSISDSPIDVRCYAQMPRRAGEHYADPNACFIKVQRSNAVVGQARLFSHIPLPLMRLPNDNERRIGSLKAETTYLIEQNLECSIQLLEIKSDLDIQTREIRQLAQDSANYLSQFYPESRNPSELKLGSFIKRKLSRTLRNNLPIRWWQLIQQLTTRKKDVTCFDNPKNERPFATLVLEPKSAIGLINTFFSLVHQTYSGWELVLVENHEQSPAIQRAIFDFAALDERIVIVNGVDQQKKIEQINAKTRGEYCLDLRDGVSLRFSCLQHVVALVRDNGGPSVVACDFEYAGVKPSASLRCYNFFVSDQPTAGNVNRFNGTFFKRTNDDTATGRHRNVVYMQKILFHVSRECPDRRL